MKAKKYKGVDRNGIPFVNNVHGAFRPKEGEGEVFDHTRPVPFTLDRRSYTPPQRHYQGKENRRR